MVVRVAVVGAGVSGLSVAICLTDTLGRSAVDVTIVADKFSSQGITSNNAGAIIFPQGNDYASVSTPRFIEDAQRWTSVTYEWLRKVYTKGRDTYGSGIEENTMFLCHEECGKGATPWFKTLHPELESLSLEEIKCYGFPPRMHTVWKFNAFVINPQKYLQYLTQRFRESGGHLIQKKIQNLDELSHDYDIIINCTGLGARELVGDLTVYPVRGQIVEVQGPKVPVVFNKKPENGQLVYIIPRSGRILLGGSVEPHNWSTEIDPIQAESIHRNCIELYPQLKGSRMIGGWACLRPTRDTVRLEVDTDNKSALLIHNYGHGGHGFIFSWGCATEVTDIVRNHLQQAKL